MATGKTIPCNGKTYIPPFLRGEATKGRYNGMAPIKAEYLLVNVPPPPVEDDDVAESATNHAVPSASGPATHDAPSSSDQPPTKRQRTSADASSSTVVAAETTARKLTKEEKKARSGSNKGRRFKGLHDEIKACWSFAGGAGCYKGNECQLSHDLEAYLLTKDRDVYFPSPPSITYTTEAPFVLPVHEQNPFVVRGGDEGSGAAAAPAASAVPPTTSAPPTDPLLHSIDLSTTCPVFSALGYCPQAWKCRFLGGHVVRAPVGSFTEEDTRPRTVGGDDGTQSRLLPPRVVGGWEVVVDEEKKERVEKEGKEGEVNHVKNDDLRALSRRTFEFPLSVEYLKKVDPESVKFLYPRGWSDPSSKSGGRGGVVVPEELDEEAMMNAMDSAETSAFAGNSTTTTAQPEAGMTGAEEGKDDVPLRPVEKRRLEWRGKTYLAPLTTVGNLPFRRICVDYGADITCGEMALGQSIISGSKEEWALTQRHRSERNFGVQVCGGKPGFMVPTAEAVKKLVGDGVDFVDVNLGCPIDLVFQKGAGSALLDSAGRLGKILTGMNRVLGDIPLTVKFRTGVKSDKNVAHKLIPRFANEWGISAMTLHGRSRQQRYAKLADWDYIKECADTLRTSCADAGLPAPPIFGNGDCFSAQQYYDEMEHSGVDGVMVARGALIKPWIFTEIQERREWDISATERLEGYRKYAEYGLSHWGSDTKGVNTTRRFLCEAISFQHRYIPIGLLERLPGMMNERPPAYQGRSELETLLASPNSADWVKISEMFLGKSPEDFVFNPKHKSNAYGAEEGNG